MGGMDDDAFFRSIDADPAADTPRLVYADWLDDQNRPREADYLRTELAAAARPDDATVRARLWQAWAGVDPAWLLAATQPLRLRANPTPYPAGWLNSPLDGLRDEGGTYGGWGYETVPPLPIAELRGEFQYLRDMPGRPEGDGAERRKERLEATRAEAARFGVVLPQSFVRFMSDAALPVAIDSPTDCYFTLPRADEPVRMGPHGEGVHVVFYADSQYCLVWDLYLHPHGGHCVVARSPDEPDPEDGEDPVGDGPRAWFVAPSFEAFVWRVAVESQVWYDTHAGSFPGRVSAAMEPAIRAYRDHYRRPVTGP